MPDSLNRLFASDWATDLPTAGSVATLDTPVHPSTLRRELSDKLDQLCESANIDSPLDWLPAGGEDSGQTDALSFLRCESLARRIYFVLVDMTDVHDFWTGIHRGFLHSLQQSCADGTTQYTALLEDLLGLPGPLESLQDAMATLRTANRVKLARLTGVFINMLARCNATATACHRDVLRALIGLNSNHQATASVGLTWLRGKSIEESDQRAFGFQHAQRPVREIVEGLSWWMSLVAPTVLVFDQLDALDSQLRLAVNLSDEVATDAAAPDETAVTELMIDEIGCGLTSLRHSTRRTLTLISCGQATWETLLHRVERLTTTCPLVS